MTESVDPQWNKQYQKLVGFKRKHGNCLVPRGYMEDVSLGKWVSWQRHFHSKNTLRFDRKDLLDEIGFAWNVQNHQWHLQYQKLVEFQGKNGHCLVPKKYQKDASFGTWVITQRQFHANNSLRLDRKELLDEIGFVWKADRIAARVSGEDKKWHQQYEQLVEFKRNNGHCRVLRRYQENKSLGEWVNTQRQSHANNTLRFDRKDLLNEIGFAWKAPASCDDYKWNDKNWHQQYEKLVEFKRNNGNCLVPQKKHKDKSLGMWVSWQRAAHANNTLRFDRKDLLNEIGFVWNKENHQWHLQYQKLVEFQGKNGHCLVPRTYKEDASFGTWVSDQRQLRSKNSLQLDRKNLLEELGFDSRVAKSWKRQYEKLVEFKRNNGHCLVPSRYKEDVSLGNWVRQQRVAHTKNKMRQDQKELLDEIGFVWKADTTGAARCPTTNVSCR
jgi:hypothetical protein